MRRVYLIGLVVVLIAATHVPAVAQYMMPSGSCYWGACRNWMARGRYYQPPYRPYGQFYRGYYPWGRYPYR
jgi:hypothetical protein